MPIDATHDLVVVPVPPALELLELLLPLLPQPATASAPSAAAAMITCLLIVTASNSHELHCVGSRGQARLPRGAGVRSWGGISARSATAKARLAAAGDAEFRHV